MHNAHYIIDNLAKPTMSIPSTIDQAYADAIEQKIAAASSHAA